jgi:hypothetical protein
MFNPIRLKGESLGVQICHDMFYGLVGRRLSGSGARVLIDLTAGNVNLAKWRNIVRARSLEIPGPFLCTMGHDPVRKSGSAAGLAYQAGWPLSPLADTTGAGGAGGYVVFGLGGSRPLTDDAQGDGDQAYSDKVYAGITISLGTGRPADVMARLAGDGVEVTGPRTGNGCGRWLGFTGEAGRIGVLPLPLSDLPDGAAVHRLDAPDAAFDHHIVLYQAREAPARMRDALSLMKLRAIEHRVGVALLAGDSREALKTSRYKNIQRFAEFDGVFGFNPDSMGGTWSTAGANSLQGVPLRWFSSYLALLS